MQLPNFSKVARPGFEPRQTIPKTVVLPLYYRAILFQVLYFPEMECKYRALNKRCKFIL